jgi:DNA repair protein RecN (Recombination protein N)
MLQSLTVKNYALLADIEIKLGSGLNVLTGETGAGKSIIIGALATILGERADSSVVRDGASKGVVEGQFEINGYSALRNLLEEHDLSTGDDLLILRREIYENSRTRAFVNDSPVAISLLQKIGDLLVDLHGQHEHQSLLKVSQHLHFLDEFGGMMKEKEAVAKAYSSVQLLLQDLEQLERQQRSINEKRDFYKFQIKEINKVSPADHEEEQLGREETISRHGEKLVNSTSEFYRLLYDDEGSVFDRLNHVEQGLDELCAIDETFMQYKSDFQNAKLTIEELAKFLRDYGSNIEFSPDRLEQIQARLSELSGLKKKFGRSLSEILKLRDEMSDKIAKADDFDAKIGAMQEKIAKVKGSFSRACLTLSKKRQNVALELQKRIPEILGTVGMKDVRFEIVLRHQEDRDGLVSWRGSSYHATGNGMDFAEFFISVNKGQEVRSLVKVASGGEISRIMLALKSIAAKQGQIPVLVFDEIDSGVSGWIAQAVGRRLKELASHHQVICITHLPQIASMEAEHYLVEKVEKESRIETVIRKLASGERAEAIASLLAGEKISESHLTSARELIQDATVN